MLLSLEINDSKARDFLNFLKELDFVKIKQSELNDEEQTDLLNERLEEYRSAGNNSYELKAVLEDLKNKYGF